MAVLLSKNVNSIVRRYNSDKPGMEGAIVFVFLMDNLPGFDMILNRSLHDTSPPILHTTLQHCRTIVAEPILMSLSKLIRSHVHMNATTQRTFNDLPSDLGTLFDSSLPDYEREGSVEMFEKSFEIDNELYSVRDKIEYHAEISKERNNTNHTMENSQVLWPKSAPFMAAIFESLSNITAQTCAGALVSKDWVLTAASCINVLREFYGSNTTDSQTKSQYTVVVNATDPLIDGTIHNVTTILINPLDKALDLYDNTRDPIHNPYLHQSDYHTFTTPKSIITFKTRQNKQASLHKAPEGLRLSNDAHQLPDPTYIQASPILTDLNRMLSDQINKLSDPEDTPNLALMRIDPAAEGVEQMALGEVGDGSDVRVYGWILDKDTSDNSMHSCYLPAQTSPCRQEFNTGLCLSMTNETTDKINKVSSGGPVLTIRDHKVTLIGVAQTDERAINVYNVATHHTWIQNVLNSQWK